MALVDPNIALGFRQPEQPNMLGQYAQIAQLQSGQQAQQLNALKMQEAQAAMQERNALRQLDPSSPDYAKQLMRVSPTQGLAYQKNVSEAATAEATRGKTLAETAAAKQKFMSQSLRDISGRPDNEQITTYLRDVQSSSLFTPDEKLKAEQNAAMLIGMPFEERKAYLASQGASASDLKPSNLQVNQGGQTQVLQMPAFGGAGTSVGTYADVPLPANVEAQRARIALAGRAPRPEAAPRTQQVTLSDGSLGIVNMDTGVITPSTVGGAAVKGKPSAFAEKAAAQKAQMGRDVNLTIKELTDAVKDGGLIDQSTGSGAGAWADIAAGFVGKATPGAIAVGKLAPIADLALKMVPRFEGPQSDKDTMSYKQAAGQLANPSLPNAIRKEAGKTVLRLMQERKNQFASSDAAPAGVAPPAGFTPD